MPSTASTVYQDGIEGKLLAAVSTSTTTGITFKIKQINGTTPTAPTAAFRLHVTQKTATTSKHEIFGVAAGTTQSGQTVTLGTVTRALPLNDGTTFTGTGTAQSFAAGADTFFSWDAHDASQTAKIDIANTFTAAQTYSGGITLSGTTKTIQLPQLTTAQRDAIVSPQNGMLIYNTDTGVNNQYIAGAWTTFATGTVSNAANGTGGKVDLATAAENAAGTATDASSGSPNVIPTSIVKATSTGAVSGTVPMLNTSVMLDGTIGGIGAATPATGKLLLGAGAGVAMTSIGPGSANQVPVSNGTTTAYGAVPTYDKPLSATFGDSTAITATSETVFDTHTPPDIPANDLINEVMYEIGGVVDISSVVGGFRVGVQIGGASYLVGVTTSTATGSATFRAIVMGTAAAGASVAVRGHISMVGAAAAASAYATANKATNGALTIRVSGWFVSSGSMVLRMLTVKRVSTSPAQ